MERAWFHPVYKNWDNLIFSIPNGLILNFSEAVARQIQDGQLGEAAYLSHLSGNVHETGCDSSLSTQSLSEMC